MAKDHEDRKTGFALMQHAVQQLSKTNNKYLLAKATYGLSDYYDYSKDDELTKKISYVQTAAKIYSEGGYIEDEAFCYKNIADLSPDVDSSFVAMNKAYALYKSVHYKQMQGVYDLFTQYYMLKSDYKKALEYGLLAYQTADRLHDNTNMMCAIENHLAMIYHYVKDPKNELIILLKALDVAKANNDLTSINIVSRNIVELYLKANQPAKAKEILQAIPYQAISEMSTDNALTLYRLHIIIGTELGELSDCKTYISKIIPLLKNNLIPPNVKSDCYVALAKYYLKAKDYDEAKKNIMLNDSVIKKLSSPLYQQVENTLWMRLDTSQQNFKSAFFHSLTAQKFYDTLYSMNKLKEIQQLQIQFETNEKEQQINFLQQKSALETKNLEQEKKVKNYTIAGIILVLIMQKILIQEFRKLFQSAVILLNFLFFFPRKKSLLTG